MLGVAVAGTFVLLGGCHASRSAPPSVSEPPEPTVSVTPSPSKSQPAERVPDLEVEIVKSWPRLFLAEGDVPSGDVALSVEGLIATQREMLSPGPMEDPFGNGAMSLREQLLLLGYLKESGLDSDPEFEAEVRRRLRGELATMVLDRAAAQSVSVSEEEVRALYEQRQEEFRQPPRVSVRLILVSTESEARSVIERVNAGEDFTAVAQEVSLHSSRSSGGRIQPFSRGTYSPELEELAFELRPGELGSVASSRGHFVVLKIADAEQSVMPFEQVRARLYAELKEQREREARRSFIQSLETRGLVAGDGEADTVSN